MTPTDARRPASAVATPGPDGARQQSLRHHNLAVLAQRIVGAPAPVTRAGLATATGMTKATVSALVDRLVEAGIVTQHEPVASQGHGRPGAARPGAGRPAAPLTASHGRLAALGLEVNVSYVAARLLDIDGSVLADAQLARPNTGSNPVEVLGEAARLAAALIAQLEASGGRLVGVGLALPGLIDATGVLRVAPNLGWRDVDAAALLDSLGVLPPVDIILNEANAGALAYARATHETSFLYVSGEVGVGAGIVLDTQLYTGIHGWSGEVGHMVIDQQGPPCGCGSRGCLEQYVGTAALARAADLPPGSGIDAINAALASGNREAQRAVAAASGVLGVALSGFINLLDVPHVVLGGAFAQLPAWFADGVGAEMRARVIAAHWEAGELRVTQVADGAASARTGVARAVFDRLLADPHTWMETGHLSR